MGSDSTPQPSAPPAPEGMNGTAPPQPTDPRIEKLTRFLNQYEITIADAQDLVHLQDYDVVFIADDSGSMDLSCAGGGGGRSLFGKGTTRWDELRDTIGTTIELASCVIEGTVDLYFLNRERITNVAGKDDPRVKLTMGVRPSGGTPLTERLSEVIEAKSNNERPVLVVIATDGEPNGGPGPLMAVIEKAIAKRNTNTTFKFQILACTDDDSSVGWMNSFDDKYKEVDVTDDYLSERSQVLAAGKVSVFTRSDWVMKALLGPICERFDSLDEHKKSTKDWSLFIFIILISILYKILLP